MATVTLDQIKDFAGRIAEEFHPQKLVLFGSHTKGNASQDSDVDLLVVLPFNGKPVHKSVEMRMKLRPPFPVDLIVRTPEKVQERLSMGDGFIKDIMDNGITLYEADNR